MQPQSNENTVKIVRTHFREISVNLLFKLFKPLNASVALI